MKLLFGLSVHTYLTLRTAEICTFAYPHICTLLMNTRLLFPLVAAAFVALLFLTPPYSVLFDTTLLHPPASYAWQLSHQGADERRAFRYGNSYTYFMRCEGVLEQAHIEDPVILLPPQPYLDSMGVAGVHMPEPAEFYYYTGHKAVRATSPAAQQARWTFTPNKTEVILKPINSQQELNELLQRYRNYKE
jgi:hypothetical protein